MGLIVGFLKSLTRISAQVRKELIQVRRRPGAFFSLVLGPFLIMALFGLGYTGIRKPLSVVLVAPPDMSLPSDPTELQNIVGPTVDIVAISADNEAALSQLRDQQIDAVVTIPANLAATFKSGKQAEIGIEINQIDPTNAAYAEFIANHVIQQVNGEILKRAVAQGENYAVQQGLDPPIEIPPDVIAAPTTSRLVNIAPTQPLIVTFFAPAVLALILQHMSVTLTALSFVRERLSGTMEIFRVSPINATELVLGKYIGLGVVGAVIATVTALLLVGLLGVPLLGNPLLFAGVIFLLVFASLGAGLFISVVSDSERQAVQLSLLMLLASVFFSGFVLPVHEFAVFLQPVSYALPVTSGIRLLQDLMLRGGTVAWWQIGLLAGIGLALLLLTAVMLRRQLHRA
jgi:ABC-2 type transport system permease protein